MAARILVTGASGHLGSQVAQRAAEAGAVVVGTYHTTPTGTAGEPLDIRDPAAVRRLVERVRPAAGLHTAPGREDWRVIAGRPAHVARAAAALPLRLVRVPSQPALPARAVHYAASPP